MYLQCCKFKLHDEMYVVIQERGLFPAACCMYKLYDEMYVVIQECGLFPAACCMFKLHDEMYVVIQECGLFPAACCMFKLHDEMYVVIQERGLFPAAYCMFKLHDEMYVVIQERGLFPAAYCMQDAKMDDKKSALLDYNHTHFLLVDNGTESKPGVEIEFRAKLEYYISTKVETGVTESQSEFHRLCKFILNCFIRPLKLLFLFVFHNLLHRN